MLKQILGASRFDQCVLNMALIHLCNQNSYVGQELLRRANPNDEWTEGDTTNPHVWSERYGQQQLKIYVPHPDQEYEGITLSTGLTQGYNLEVEPLRHPERLPYKIPPGGQFVLVVKQKRVDGGFELAATGVFVRSLALLSLEIIVDPDQPEYQSVAVLHPIIREYPSDWQQKLQQFLAGDVRSEDLPQLVGYVDQRVNRDYRPPDWSAVYLAAKGFAGV